MTLQSHNDLSAQWEAVPIGMLKITTNKTFRSAQSPAQTQTETSLPTLSFLSLTSWMRRELKISKTSKEF